MSKGIQSAEDIREDLECPVCQVIPKSVPIYQCKAGHIHCKECHPRLQNCPVCMNILIKLIHKIWSSEDVPEKFARATFVMLFKDKGSSDDPTKYRCLVILNHAYKGLSQSLLERINKGTEHYLSEWQTGFRATRAWLSR